MDALYSPCFFLFNVDDTIFQESSACLKPSEIIILTVELESPHSLTGLHRRCSAGAMDAVPMNVNITALLEQSRHHPNAGEAEGGRPPPRPRRDTAATTQHPEGLPEVLMRKLEVQLHQIDGKEALI